MQGALHPSIWSWPGLNDIEAPTRAPRKRRREFPSREPTSDRETRLPRYNTRINCKVNYM